MISNHYLVKKNINKNDDKIFQKKSLTNIQLNILNNFLKQIFMLKDKISPPYLVCKIFLNKKQHEIQQYLKINKLFNIKKMEYFELAIFKDKFQNGNKYKFLMIIQFIVKCLLLFKIELVIFN